jgi:hypothetical protein
MHQLCPNITVGPQVAGYECWCDNPENDEFRSQARRAERVVTWPFRVVFAVFVGLVLCLAGLAFAQSSLPGLGIPLSLVGVCILFYGLWWGFVGRFRLLTCPVCGSRGAISKDEWAYLFHCPRCGRTADTGVGVRRAGDYSP